MTWGRKNGDASNCATWPPVCTYHGMDSLLYERYAIMAESNDALLSPVGAVWHRIRNLYPALELYQPDESHPSEAGSYAAAVTFYAVLFRKDPTLSNYDFTLSPTDADNIRQTVKSVVFDSLLKWHIGEYDPFADFSAFPVGGADWCWANSSTGADTWAWDFGDGSTDTTFSPTHTFTPGTWLVRLIASRCGRSDTAYQTISIPTSMPDVNMTQFLMYPNPPSGVLQILLDETPFDGNIQLTSGSGITYSARCKDGIVDISQFPEGIWTVILHTSNGKLHWTRLMIINPTP